MPAYPDLFVMRHGQTVWNLAGRFQGRLDSDLTALGRGQAKQQAGILQALKLPKSATGCFSSPQGRALATAKIALAPLGQAIVADHRLQEIAFGDWEGMTTLDIEHHAPDVKTGGPDKSWYFSAPNGESFQQIGHRLRQFLQSLDRPAAVVTHGFTSIILRGIWLGMDKADMLVLPHKQGCVYHLSRGRETCLSAD